MVERREIILASRSQRPQLVQVPSYRLRTVDEVIREGRVVSRWCLEYVLRGPRQILHSNAEQSKCVRPTLPALCLFNA